MEDEQLHLQNRTNNIAQILLLVLLIAGAFSNVPGNGFLWDDPLFVLDIPAYRSFNLGLFFTTLTNGREYLPIRDISYALDFMLWGKNPAGFHITNLLLHLGNVIAVYLLAEKLAFLFSEKKEKHLLYSRTAFWTAAIFALHPLQCETINFISGGRNTLLAAFFGFLSVYTYIIFLERRKGHGGGLLAAAITLFVLAVLSKAIAVTIPLFLIFLALTIRNRSNLTRICSLLPFLAVSCAISIIFTSIASSTGTLDPFSAHVPMSARIAISTQIPFVYVWKFLVPLHLSPDYDMVFSPSLLSTATIASIGALILAVVIIFFTRKQFPWLGAALLFFAVCLLPVMQFVIKKTIVSDRYSYIPLFALCFITSSMISRLNLFIRARAACLLVLLLAALSFRQNRIWKSSQTLWEHVTATSPRSVTAATNLGTIYFRKGNYVKAFEMFDRARKVDDTDASYDFFEGFLFHMRGDYRAALRDFERVLSKQHDMMDALFYKANACEQLGDRKCAQQYYVRTLESLDIDRGGYKNLAAKRLSRLQSP